MVYDVVTFRAVRYVVLGGGAGGGTVAAGLVRDGHEVLACDCCAPRRPPGNCSA